MKAFSMLEVRFARRNAGICPASPTEQFWLRHTSSAALILLLLTIVFMPTSSQAQVNITVPGNITPSIQLTGAVPLRAVANSGNSFAVDKVQVLDGTTQIGIYAGNGTTQMDLRGVFALSVGTHTITVTETDTNGGTQSASTTFVVASTGDVTQSPAQDSESPAPVSWQATCTANSGQVIAAMDVYLDFNSTPIASYSGLNQSSVTKSASFSSTQIPNGSHSLTTNCWDSGTGTYQSSVDFTVGTSFPGPSGSSVTLNLDNPAAGWNDCPGCAGDFCSGTGTNLDASQQSDTYPATPSVGYPTIDNDSRNFSITTTTNAFGCFQGFLWYTNFSNSSTQFANGYPVNWIYDYYVNVGNPVIGQTDIEFDGNQTAGLPAGWGIVLGTECNLSISQPGNFWRFWNAGHWDGVDAGVTCPLTDYGHWYHVQMYFTLDVSLKQYTVQNVRVKDTSINSVVLDRAPGVTFGAENTTGHGNGLDVQLDGYGDQTYPVTYDKINVIRW